VLNSLETDEEGRQKLFKQQEDCAIKRALDVDLLKLRKKQQATAGDDPASSRRRRDGRVRWIYGTESIESALKERRSKGEKGNVLHRFSHDAIGLTVCVRGANRASVAV
jgi:hypothetical protein